MRRVAIVLVVLVLALAACWLRACGMQERPARAHGRLKAEIEAPRSTSHRASVRAWCDCT